MRKLAWFSLPYREETVALYGMADPARIDAAIVRLQQRGVLAQFQRACGGM